MLEKNRIESPGVLKFKAADGFFTLGVRRVLVQAIQTSGNIILARVFFPEVFGLFALLVFFLNIFTLFTDIGLTMAIIQHKKEPTLSVLRSIFAIHVLLGIIATCIFWALSPFLFGFYTHLSSGELLAVQLSSLTLLFFNFKLIPQALLERAIRYRRIVLAEVSEVFITTAVTVVFAISGFGFFSFVWGLLAGRFFAVIIYFLLQPWRIGFSFSFRGLQSFFYFGLTYQSSNIVGTFGGANAPVVVGGILGVTALGLVNWAGGVAALPRVVSEIVSRLLFSIGGRTQDNPIVLEKTIEKAMHVASFFSFPLIALVVVLGEPITYLIFTDKWLPGLGVVYIFSLYGILLIFQDIFVHALLAVGEAKLVRDVMFFTVLFQWLLSYFLVIKLGLIGFPVAWFLTGFNCIPLYIGLTKRVPLTIFSDILKILFLSFIAAVGLFVLTMFFPVQSLFQLVLYGVLGLLFYFFLFFIARRNVLFADIALLVELVSKKR